MGDAMSRLGVATAQTPPPPPPKKKTLVLIMCPDYSTSKLYGTGLYISERKSERNWMHSPKIEHSSFLSMKYRFPCKLSR